MSLAFVLGINERKLLNMPWKNIDQEKKYSWVFCTDKTSLRQVLDMEQGDFK